MKTPSLSKLSAPLWVLALAGGSLLSLFTLTSHPATAAAKDRAGDVSGGGPVTLRAEVDRPVLPSGDGEQKVVVRIDLTGGGGAALERNPVNLAVVLDRSGSMSGRKLEQAKQAAHLLVDQLDREDTFSLVIYDTEVEVVVPAERLGDRRRNIQRTISRIQTGGSTALHDGVRTGGEQLREFLSSRRINRVMLLSDGIANVGPSSNREIARLGQRLAGDEISVTTIGLGDDYNENLMTALAEASDANYYYVADVEELPEVFRDELGELKSLVARDIVIRIEFPDGVRPLRILGRPGELEGQAEEVVFKTLASEQSREILLECAVDASASGAGDSEEIARVEVRYADSEGRPVDARPARTVTVGYSDDTELVENAVNREVAADAAIYANAAMIERVVADADRGDVAAARAGLVAQESKLEEVQAAAPVSKKAAIQLEIDQVKRARSQLGSAGFSKSGRKELQNRAWQLRNAKEIPSR